jgi:hypothetical protein
MCENILQNIHIQIAFSQSIHDNIGLSGIWLWFLWQYLAVWPRGQAGYEGGPSACFFFDTLKVNKVIVFKFQSLNSGSIRKLFSVLGLLSHVCIIYLLLNFQVCLYPFLSRWGSSMLLFAAIPWLKMLSLDIGCLVSSAFGVWCNEGAILKQPHHCCFRSVAVQNESYSKFRFLKMYSIRNSLSGVLLWQVLAVESQNQWQGLGHAIQQTIRAWAVPHASMNWGYCDWYVMDAEISDLDHYMTGTYN